MCALFVLGTINNLTYVVVISAASNIACHFDKKDLIGLIPLCNILLGLVSKGQ